MSTPVVTIILTPAGASTDDTAWAGGWAAINVLDSQDKALCLPTDSNRKVTVVIRNVAPETAGYVLGTDARKGVDPQHAREIVPSFDLTFPNDSSTFTLGLFSTAAAKPGQQPFATLTLTKVTPTPG